MSTWNYDICSSNRSRNAKELMALPVFRMKLLLFFIVILADSLQCLKCDHVISPLLCTGKTTCDATEVCFIEKYKGSDEEIYFNLGCKLRNKCGIQGGVDICNNCCESELCNYNGCGQTALVDNHGPICLSCSQTIDPSRCDTIQLCEQGEQCHIEETNQFGIHFYKTGCMSEHNCRHFLSPTDIFGRRSISKRNSVTCAQCCKGTLCNNQCTQGIMSTEATSSVLTTTLSVPTIPRITTIPTTQTTTPIPNGDHKGTEFYLMFIIDFNIINQRFIQLIITTEDRATVVITSPFAGVNQTVTVTGGLKVVDIPSTIDHISSDNKYDRGIHISSDKPISVAGVSNMDCCTAYGFNVLPSKYLETEYNVATMYQSIRNGQSFGLVSTADNNTILLKSKTIVSISFLGTQLPRGQNVSFQLNRLQTYFFENSRNDISGIQIISTKPIVLFSGNSVLTTGGGDMETSAENTLPIKYWGQSFVIPLIPSSRISLNFAICKMNTQINITGSGYSTTHLTSSAQTVDLDEGSYTVSASHPILVTLYTKRTNTSINPFMSTVPATTQYSYNYVVGTPTFQTRGDKVSYMAIMIKQSDYGGLHLNGKPLATLREQAISLNGEMYKTVVVQLDDNVANRLTHSNPKVVYGAIVYGYAKYIAYGYPAGFRL